MSLETESDAEEFLWSLCTGFDGNGWTKHGNSEHNFKIVRIRRILRTYCDEQLYGKTCNVGGFYMADSCEQMVTVDSKTCYHHNKGMFKQ